MGTLLKWSLVALVAIAAWDLSGLDLALARWVGSVHGFPLREHWLFSSVLHGGARRLSWVIALAICIGVWWPAGVLRRLSTSRRAQLAVTTLAAAGAVSLVKSFSMTSCPWDLEIFGGFARHVSHWAAIADGGSGHCFPAGHASAGFALMGGYFAFADQAPALARRWLMASLAAGMVLGLAQQARGAHFMSHTFWTGFACWCVALGIHAVMQLWRARAGGLVQAGGAR